MCGFLSFYAQTWRIYFPLPFPAQICHDDIQSLNSTAKIVLSKCNTSIKLPSESKKIITLIWQGLLYQQKLIWRSRNSYIFPQKLSDRYSQSLKAYILDFCLSHFLCESFMYRVSESHACDSKHVIGRNRVVLFHQSLTLSPDTGAIVNRSPPFLRSGNSQITKS